MPPGPSNSVSDIANFDCSPKSSPRTPFRFLNPSLPPAGAVALGQLLRQRGFECWDLGMTLDYKTRLGAALVSRTEFVGRVKRSRVEHKGLALTLAGRRNAKEFVDWDRPAAAAKGATPKGNSRPEQNGATKPSSGKVEASPKTKRKRPHTEGKGAS